MAIHWYKGIVTQIQPLTEITRQFTISVEDDAIFDFTPGQFVTFDLPIGEKRIQRWRSYSIANAPDGSNKLEFCIVHSDFGLATNYLFNNISIGSEIRFKGPDGVFVIPKDLVTNEIIMICTGTGIAPFRSMWQYIDRNQLPFNKIHVIFGTRFENSILYLDELETMKNKYPNFDFDIVLSRENHPNYKHGYIHNLYLDMYADLHENRRFYICGWSGMIDDTLENLTVKLGYDKSQIRNELYG